MPHPGEDDDGHVSAAANEQSRQRLLAAGTSAEDVRLLFGAPPQGPTPGAAPDIAGMTARLSTGTAPGHGPDIASMTQRLSTAGREAEQPIRTNLVQEFLDDIRTPEEEMFDRHATYAARVRDIPHDTAGQVVQGIERIRSAGTYEPDDSRGFKIVKDVARVGLGTAQVMFSPVTGTAQSLIGRPLAERGALHLRTDGTTSREEFNRRSFWDRVKGATPHAEIEVFDERRPADPEQMEKITGLSTFVLPGVGVVRYGDMARRLRNTAVPRAIERILSPTTVSDDARAAEEMLRGAGGQAARDTETTRAVLQAHQRVINRLPEADRLRFIGHIEGGPLAIAHLPQPLQDLANNMRDAFNIRRQHLQQLPSTAGADFVDNYFPHMWQDPTRARALFPAEAGQGSRQGSGASLRARTIPTVADGLAAGLQPVTTDPIELSMRYVTSMDRFIAAERAREVAIQSGYATWIRPRVVGASGHPQSMDVPQGFVPLGGRGSTRLDNARLYAPEDFARVYNNFISRGVEGDWGNVYNGLLRSSNFVTAFELSLSGYHALAMTHEAAVSQMASAIQNIVGGVRQGDVMQILRGGAQAVTHPLAAVSRYGRGRQLERAYLGLTPGTPDMGRIVGLLERAGGRAVGSRHAQIQASAASNYWQALRAGSLRAMHAADLADIRANPVLGSARTLFRTLGRAMDTISHPLFNVYIPRLKNGAFYETMQTWLHNHPNATYPEQVRAARMVWDSIDNRFGEMVQDNIFWHNTLKRAAQLGMRSYSWNMGTIREIGGGAMDIMTGGRQAAPVAGQAPNRLVDSTRAAYVVALPFVVGTMNAIYQYLKTGSGPETVDDLVAARTGANVPGPAVPSNKPFGRSQRNEIPERVMLPGYQKDVFGWYENWQGEMINKIATLPRTALQIAMNRDWRDLPIVNPEDSAPEWLKQYFKFALDTYGPISMRQKDKETTAISGMERKLGLREAPPYIGAPQDFADQQSRLNQARQRQKANIEKRQKQIYGGTDEE